MRQTRSLLVLLILVGACRPAYVLEDPDQVFVLQTNLRPNARGQMTSVLDWRGTEVLPLCTRVRIDDVDRGEIRFTAVDSGESYRYILHRSTRLPVAQHVERYFGQRCPVEVVDEVDAQGIQNGDVYGGMSREGVLLALGYPPEHRTPSLESDEWTYWGTTGPVTVIFSGDRVVAVDDPAGAHVAPGEQVAPPTGPAPAPDDPASAAPNGSDIVVVEHGTGGAPVVEDSNRPPPQASAPAREPAAEPSPDAQSGRRGRRRRRRLRRVGRVAAGAAIGAAGQIRVQRRTTVTRSGGSNRSAGNGSRQPAPEPTITRRQPERAQLDDRCGRGQPACGPQLICDGRSSRCKYKSGTFSEAPNCTSDSQCPHGAICGVSQLQPERGQLCWNEASGVVRR